MRLAPVVEQLAQEYKGKIKFFLLDVHNNYDTTVEFGVMRIPQLLFFKGGKEVGRLMGAVPKAQIVEELAKIA